MFALPDAKRVRRSDLFSARSRSASPASSTRSASSSPDPEAAAALLRARLDAQLGAAPVIASPVATDTTTNPGPNTNDNAQDDGDEDEELEFRLFAAPTKPAATPIPQQKSSAAKSQPAVQKIRLRSPSLDPDRPAGFVNPSRPRSYYFAPAADSAEAQEQRTAFAATAVSGAEILERAAAIRWPGCAVPWKVSVLDPASGKLRKACVRHGEPAGSDADDGEEKKGGKRRKSKKARVALRKKRAKGLERKEAAERAAKEKEEAEKLKRQEKNRKQKLKRREKERARKAAERGESGAAGGEQDGGEKDEDVVMGEDED